MYPIFAFRLELEAVLLFKGWYRKVYGVCGVVVYRRTHTPLTKCNHRTCFEAG